MIRLLACNSPGYQALADVTDATKRFYARRWGHEFRTEIHAGVRPIAWERPEFWLRHLEKCDWLFFTGTDAMITNPDIDVAREFALEKCGSDFIVSADGNGLQSDSWLMRNCGRTRDFLRRVIGWEDGTGNEQDAMSIELSGARNYDEFTRRVGDLKQDGEPPSARLLLKLAEELNRSPVAVQLVEQRRLNAYPHELYGGSNDLPHSWHPGDFVCHTPGISLERRLEYMPKLIATP